MKFATAQRKYADGRIQNPAVGRALGNYTYLYKVHDKRYEVRKPHTTYTENPNFDAKVYGSCRYLYEHSYVSIFSIEPTEDGKTRIEILFDEKFHNQTIANVLSKHINSLRTFIRNYEMRFGFYNSGLPRGSNAPVVKQGLKFTIDERNYITLDEGQKITSDKRFINREKAKPINVRLKQLNVLGTVMTKLESVTKADVNGAIDGSYTDNKRVLDKLFTEEEFVVDDVYRVLATTLGYWERNQTAPDPIKNQHSKFQTAMAALRKQAYKRAGVLEAKEIERGNTTN